MRLVLRNALSVTHYWLLVTAAVLTSTATVFAARRRRTCKPPISAHTTRRVAISTLVPSSAAPITSFSTTDEPMSSYRCSSCGENWPHQMDFRLCLECGNPCWVSTDQAPMDDDEAQSRLRQHKFERYYQDRDQKALEHAAAEIAELPETEEPRVPLRMRWGA